MFSIREKFFNKRRDIALLCVVSVFVSLYGAYSIVFFAKASDTVREDVVRLHILANSDSCVDQQVKLLVRDALLRENEALSQGYVTTEEAEEYFKKAKNNLAAVANRVLKEQGFSYTATVTLGEEYYETRQYGELTFPAGVYTSLRVVLGNGEGHNWWCVMFPPLCVPVAGDIETDEKKTDDHLTESGHRVVNGDYVIKFRIIEIYEELKNRFQ